MTDAFPACSSPNRRRFPSQSGTSSPTLRSPRVQRSWRSAGAAPAASGASWPGPGKRAPSLGPAEGFFSTDSAVFISVQNLQPSAALDFSELDSALQQQERIMNVSQVLASEASRKSKLVAGWFPRSTRFHAPCFNPPKNL